MSPDNPVDPYEVILDRRKAEEAAKCGECGHLLSKHVHGYGCGVEVNGDLCKCETGQ